MPSIELNDSQFIGSDVISIVFHEKLTSYLRYILHAKHVSKMEPYDDQLATFTCGGEQKQQLYVRIEMISRKQNLLKPVQISLKVDVDVAIRYFLDLMSGAAVGLDLVNFKNSLTDFNDVVDNSNVQNEFRIVLKEPDTFIPLAIADDSASNAKRLEVEPKPVAVNQGSGLIVNTITLPCARCDLSEDIDCNQCPQPSIKCSKDVELHCTNHGHDSLDENDLFAPMNLHINIDRIDVHVSPKDYDVLKLSVANDILDDSDAPHQYELLQKLDDSSYVSNVEEFVCALCFVLIAPLKGVVLRECIHQFCAPCLVNHICMVDSISVGCPFKSDAYDCEQLLQQRDMRAVLPVYKFNELLDKSVMAFDTAVPVERRCNEQRNRDAPNAIELRLNEAILLEELDNIPVVLNEFEFECSICFVPCAIGDGIKLRDCLHIFCKQCIVYLVQNRTDCQIMCPSVNAELAGCDGIIEEREIRGILSDDQFDTYMQRTHILSLNKVLNAFPCRTTDCMGYWIIEPGDVEFSCEVCGIVNCLKCKTIHENLTCGQFEEVRSGKTALSQQYIQMMIANGTAMVCPQCQAVITKSGGCDGMVCPSCKIDICWVTKGRRWGPLGKNDTSAGCRCNVGGRLCHPNCGNCH